MKKIFLFISVIIMPLYGMTTEPWSGIGVVFFRCHYPEMTVKAMDLDIYDSTFTQILHTINSTNLNPTHEVEFVEFANDIKGLCIASIRQNIIKVILREDGNDIRFGWVKKENENIDYLLWSSLIPAQRNVFPLNNEDGIADIQFYKAPYGEILDIEVPLMKELTYDYHNEVIKRYDCDLVPTGFVSRQSWMQVDISYPHDEGNDNFECHRVRCWIRYLDDTGHPLVWFYTRD